MAFYLFTNFVAFYFFSFGRCEQLSSIFWISSNPLFREDDHVFTARIKDTVEIHCPLYNDTVTQDQAEFSIIYMVSQDGYNDCTLLNEKAVGQCLSPYTESIIKLTFRDFTPTPKGFEFQPGNYYYFISTSTGQVGGLHNRDGGLCKSNNLKMKVAVLAPDAPNNKIDFTESKFSNSVEPPRPETTSESVVSPKFAYNRIKIDNHVKDVTATTARLSTTSDSESLSSAMELLYLQKLAQENKNQDNYRSPTSPSHWYRYLSAQEREHVSGNSLVESYEIDSRPQSDEKNSYENTNNPDGKPQLILYDHVANDGAGSKGHTVPSVAPSPRSHVTSRQEPRLYEIHEDFGGHESYKSSSEHNSAKLLRLGASAALILVLTLRLSV